MAMKADWLEAFDDQETFHVLDELSTLFALRGGETARLLADLAKGRQWTQFFAVDLKQGDEGHNVTHLIAQRQIKALYEKLDFLAIPGVDKEQAAVDKFIASEESCKKGNDFFRKLRWGRVFLRHRDARVLYAARRKIASVLGRAPLLSSLKISFGPGATTSIKKRDASWQRKLAAGIECSFDLFNDPRFPLLLDSMPHLMEAHATSGSRDEGTGEYTYGLDIGICHGRLEFVDKSAKEHRSILVEPSLNTMVQSGIRKVMTRLLLNAGVDISDQSRNAVMAKIGSIWGELSTLDLSSASDTICYELVKFLLPDDWFHLLACARTGTAIYRGKVITLEKFSSMGNGFTFPLETLIFWALTVCSCPAKDIDRISVYGDDIICPSESTANVVRTLELCGFSINLDKSFAKGPFRESCGADYYHGIDIRPVYVKHHIDTASLFVLHNFFHNVGDTDAKEIIVSHIHPELRIYGPKGYGDGHLHGDYKPMPVSKKAKEKGYGGHRFDTFTRVGRDHPSIYPGDWVSPIYSVYATARTPLLESNVPLMTPSSLARLSFLTHGWRNNQLCERTEIKFNKAGRPLWALPEFDGYKRTSIYTF